MRRLILGKLPEVHFLTYGNRWPYCRGMGQHSPRTAADELHAAHHALLEAQRALKDTQSHLDQIIANPEGAAGKARAAKRSASIALSQIDQGDAGIQAAARIDTQLKSVS